MEPCDVLVVGAGAAGMMAALAARGALGRDGALEPAAPGAPSVVALDASSRPGLKILVSGGGRCNVTNERVVEADYACDAPHVLRGLLRAFPPAAVRALFERAGCPLYAEPLGKLFPTSDRARDVLAVLLRGCDRAGVRRLSGADVVELGPGGAGWVARCADGRAFAARRAVLATGGRSLPKTGSRGFGLELLARLGHTVEPPLPALTPLLLDPDGPLAGLAGLTVPALLSLVPAGAPADQVAGARFQPLARAAGSLLVTHRGASGPAALDVSGACGRARLEGHEVRLLGDFWSLAGPESPFAPYLELPKPPGACLPPDGGQRPPGRDAFRHEAAALAGERRTLGSLAAARMPRSLATALLRAAGLDPARATAGLPEGEWRRLHLALTQCDLRLGGCEGYAKAEVTAGGVLLCELDRRTLESRRLPGLFCCGEVVNVTGRLGGFNFQWAWSSGRAAGAGAGGWT